MRPLSIFSKFYVNGKFKKRTKRREAKGENEMEGKCMHGDLSEGCGGLVDEGNTMMAVPYVVDLTNFATILVIY